jgi:hypothetical protein
MYNVPQAIPDPLGTGHEPRAMWQRLETLVIDRNGESLVSTLK